MSEDSVKQTIIWQILDYFIEILEIFTPFLFDCRKTNKNFDRNSRDLVEWKIIQSLYM